MESEGSWLRNSERFRRSITDDFIKLVSRSSEHGNGGSVLAQDLKCVKATRHDPVIVSIADDRAYECAQQASHVDDVIDFRKREHLKLAS